jgi:hypothetical protein
MLTTQCSDSMSYTEQTFEIKFMPGGEIHYSPTGDPSVNTHFDQVRYVSACWRRLGLAVTWIGPASHDLLGPLQ